MLRTLVWILIGAGLGARLAESAPKPALALDGAAALEKARVGGTYRMLLRRIRVERDRKRYGDFRDSGEYRRATTDRGRRKLPRGYRVYVYPHWYIWAQRGAPHQASWGAPQATGAPDTPRPGDAATAWAPRTADGGREWLMAGYRRPVRPIGVLVHENTGPGALVKVSVFRYDGTEVVVWEGQDPTPAGAARGVSLLPVRVDFETVRVKLYLDTKRASGWNEIDAVGLLDERGVTHWAHAAQASSSYGARPRRQPHLFLPPVIATPFPPHVVATPHPLPVIATPFPLREPDATGRPARKMEELERRIEDLERRIKDLERWLAERERRIAR